MVGELGYQLVVGELGDPLAVAVLDDRLVVSVGLSGDWARSYP